MSTLADSSSALRDILARQAVDLLQMVDLLAEESGPGEISVGVEYAAAAVSLTRQTLQARGVTDRAHVLLADADTEQGFIAAAGSGDRARTFATDAWQARSGWASIAVSSSTSGRRPRADRDELPRRVRLQG
mgnify:CR=1 FL=1